MIVNKTGLTRCHILHIKCTNFNSNITAVKLLASWVPFRNRWYVVIDVQGNVRVLAFLLDRVLAFPVNLLKTIAATGAIFSLKFSKNRPALGPAGGA